MLFFQIVNNSKLVVVRPLSLDFESAVNPNISLTVLAIDNGYPPSSLSRTLVFTVIDINEAPVNVTVHEGAYVYENASVGHRIGFLDSFDWENDSLIVYELMSVNGVKDSRDFYLTTNGSTTSLHLNRSLNYDEVSSFVLEVNTTDSGRPPASAVLSLGIDVRRADPCILGAARCHPNATCFRVDAKTSECACNDGYDGDGVECAVTDHCYETEIGICSNETCDAGYLPFDCRRKVNKCASNPCGINGRCVDILNEYRCECTDGYVGTHCQRDIDDCVSSPCAPASTCYDGVAQYSCICATGYTGEACSFPTHVCRDGACPANTQCVPKAIDLPRGIGERHFICASSAYLVALPVSGNESVVEAHSRNQLELFLREALQISTRNATGLFAVYIIPSQASSVIRFVALRNNEPIKSKDVLKVIKKECSHLDQSFVEACDTITVENSTSPVEKDSPELEKSTLGLISGGAALFLLIVVGAVVFCVKKQKSKKLGAGESNGTEDRDDSDSVGGCTHYTANPVYSSACGGVVVSSPDDKVVYANAAAFGKEPLYDLPEVGNVGENIYEQIPVQSL